MAQGISLTHNGRLGSKKVKTGCFTCKVRRVKCDEAKPDCRRCKNTGRRCDGYRTSPPLQREEKDWLAKPQDPSIIVITPERTLVSFASNEQEQRSFDFYRDRTASSLAHTLDSTFWTEFILRVSDSEPAVRHALVAIGALNERLRLPALASSPTSNSSANDKNLRLALSSYNKAISCLTKQMQQGQSDLIALLTCILFICVEFLQDNIAAALSLVHQGCAIIRGQEKSDEEKTTCQKSQTHQLMIDHQVMPIFTRLTVLSALTGHPATLRILGESEENDVPLFLDLRGARSSLYMLMEIGHELIRKGEQCKWLPEAENNQMEDVRMQQSHLQAKFGHWHSRFTKLQAELELSKSTRLIQAVSLLSMYFTASSAWLGACLEKAQSSYDSYLTQFEQILQAAELFVNLSEGQSQSEILFTFEMGLVPPLYFTATRCRFPDLRRRAVSLIERAPGKEGMWDRAEMVYIARKVIETEEAEDFDWDNHSNGLPAEALRLHDVQFEREATRPGQRKTVVKYLSKPEGLDGAWRIEKQYFDV